MKPGFKTSEFWLALAAALVGALLAADVLPADTAWIKIAGLAASALAAMGYTGARLVLKTSADRATVDLAKAEAIKAAADSGN